MNSDLKPVLGSQIQLGHPLAQGLVGCWLMNEGSGSKILDLSGNNNAGTFGNTTAAPIWIAGKFGSALSFDGGDYVDFGSDSKIDNITPLTCACWINTSSSSGRILNKRTSAATGWTLFLGGTNSVRFFAEGGGINLQRYGNSNTLLLNAWQYVLLTWDRSKTAANVHIFVNAKEITYATTVNGTNTTSDAAQILYMGVDETLAANFFTGIIDNVTIWNRVLSANEIAELYMNPFAMFEEDM